MISRIRFASLAALLVLSSAGTLLWARPHAQAQAQTQAPGAPITSAAREALGTALVAGPGRVEPVSEDIKLGSELSGKLKSVLVDEGDLVSRGQLLASLESDDFAAQLASAEAQVRAKEAILRKLMHGARSQERSQAHLAVNAADAVLNKARSESERRQKLFAEHLTTQEELESAARQYDVAEAEYGQSVERRSLINAPPREEDRALARAELDLARAGYDEARARYAKTLILSPIDGSVLRKHHRAGESVSNSATVPDPILTVGDKHILRVRVEIDETQVNEVATQQRAYVTADAFGTRKFWGRVIRVGQQLGRKNIRTDEPTERVDTKVLEVLVELDPGAALPIGLRVDAFILSNEAGRVSKTAAASPLH